MTHDISPCRTDGIILGNDASGSMALPAFAFSGLLLCGLRVARSGNQQGECNPRGTTMVEGDNFSTSGPGWTVECGKEPNVMS